MKLDLETRLVHSVQSACVNAIEFFALSIPIFSSFCEMINIVQLIMSERNNCVAMYRDRESSGRYQLL